MLLNGELLRCKSLTGRSKTVFECPPNADALTASFVVNVPQKGDGIELGSVEMLVVFCSGPKNH